VAKKTYRNKGSKENIIISIAGAHGVGKTTIFNLLKKRVSQNYKFKFFPERYVKNPPFPFGSKDKQISFRSEIHFLQQFIRRNKNIANFDKNYNGRILILDRTPICVLVYSKSLNLREKDYNLILDMYDSVEWKEDYIVYLTAKPNTILKRIVQRGSIDRLRREWNEYERDYLLKVISNYKQIFLSKFDADRIFIINTDDLTQEEVLNELEKIITQLSGYTFKKLENPPATQRSLIDFLT